jgi:transcriptional regulator with XRE-family HTH domain
VNYVAKINSDQAKAARVLLGLGKLHVCRELGITPLTLDRVEIAGAKGGPPRATMLARLRRHYEAAGVEFTNDGQFGVRMCD